MALSVHCQEPFCVAHVASPARWWVLLVVAVMNILQSLLWNVFSPISDTVKVTYGWTDSDFAWAVNAANVTFMLALVPMNRLYELKGARQTMLLSTFALAFSGLVRCLPLQGFRVLVMLSMLANGVTAAWANISGPLISDLWFPARERTLATAIAVTGPPIGQALGFVVGPALVTATEAVEGLRQVRQLMWLEASLAMATFLAAWIYFPAAPRAPPSESSAVKRGAVGAGGYGQLWPNGKQACRFWLLNLCFSLPIGCYQSWTSVLNLNLADAQSGVQMSPNAVALLGCLMTLSGAAGSIAIGLVTKRLLGALKSIILLVAGVSFAGFLLFALLLTADVPPGFRMTLGAAGILGGFGVNCTLPLFFELILETVYGFVKDDVAATTTMLTMSSIQILVLLLPVKIAGSSLWMNWLMASSVLLSFCGVLLLRPRYLRLEADFPGDDVARGCDRGGCL